MPDHHQHAQAAGRQEEWHPPAGRSTTGSQAGQQWEADRRDHPGLARMNGLRHRHLAEQPRYQSDAQREKQDRARTSAGWRNASSAGRQHHDPCTMAPAIWSSADHQSGAPGNVRGALISGWLRHPGGAQIRHQRRSPVAGDRRPSIAWRHLPCAAPLTPSRSTLLTTRQSTSSPDSGPECICPLPHSLLRLQEASISPSGLAAGRDPPAPGACQSVPGSGQTSPAQRCPATSF